MSTHACAGGEPKRLTWHSSNDEVQYWTPDGKRILFSSARGPSAWDSPLYTVSIDGDLPKALDLGSGAAGMFSQDGSCSRSTGRVTPIPSATTAAATTPTCG